MIPSPDLSLTLSVCSAVRCVGAAETVAPQHGSRISVIIAAQYRMDWLQYC